jgi:Cu/Ag efflux protein CusF
MRKIMIPTAAFAVLASSTLGFAATQPMTESGTIAKIDAKTPSITLKTGKVKTFWVAKAVDVSTLKVGDKVQVSYEMMNKHPTANEIKLAP